MKHACIVIYQSGSAISVAPIQGGERPLMATPPLRSAHIGAPRATLSLSICSAANGCRCMETYLLLSLSLRKWSLRTCDSIGSSCGAERKSVIPIRTPWCGGNVVVSLQHRGVVRSTIPSTLKAPSLEGNPIGLALRSLYSGPNK